MGCFLHPSTTIDTHETERTELGGKCRGSTNLTTDCSKVNDLDFVWVDLWCHLQGDGKELMQSVNVLVMARNGGGEKSEASSPSTCRIRRLDRCVRLESSLSSC